MERAARTSGAPFRIQGVRSGERVGIHLDHRSERRPVPIDLLDPLQIELREPSRRVAARLHPLLQPLDGRFFQLERRRCLRTRRNEGHDAHDGDSHEGDEEFSQEGHEDHEGF